MRNTRLWKSTPVVLLLVAMVFSVIACSGVTQEEFDRVSEDLTASRVKAEQLSNDLAVAQSKLSAIESQVTTAEAKLAELPK